MSAGVSLGCYTCSRPVPAGTLSLIGSDGGFEQ